MAGIKATMKSRRSSLGLLAPVLFTIYPEPVMARGYHSHSTMPDWIVSLILIVGAGILTLFSIVYAVENWRNRAHLKSMSWWIVVGLSCWIILSQINWPLVLGFMLAGVSWLLVGSGLLAAGFVLKIFVGVFFKHARDMSTEEFIQGVASTVGAIAVTLVTTLSLVMIFLGIPILIVLKLFGLWE